MSRVRPYAEAAGKYPVDLLSAAARSLRCLLRADPIRYLLIELLSAISAASAFWRFGASGQALAAYGLVAALLALAWIDLQTHLLPDALTMPLLWSGLLVNLEARFAPLADAVIGALAG